MWDTMEEAITEAAAEGCEDSVEFCDICEAWTYTDTDGYPVCYCV